MITAHVNERGIVLTYSLADNLSHKGWESLLDELKSHYIPSLYQDGKRMHVDFSPEGKLRAVIYFTPQTVSMDAAIKILEKQNIKVLGVRGSPAEE